MDISWLKKYGVIKKIVVKMNKNPIVMTNLVLNKREARRSIISWREVFFAVSVLMISRQSWIRWK